MFSLHSIFCYSLSVLAISEIVFFSLTKLGFFILFCSVQSFVFTFWLEVRCVAKWPEFSWSVAFLWCCEKAVDTRYYFGVVFLCKESFICLTKCFKQLCKSKICLLEIFCEFSHLNCIAKSCFYSLYKLSKILSQHSNW